MSIAFLRRSFGLLLATAALALAGCASLPPLPTRDASAAFTDTAETPLGRLRAASLTDAPTGDSGFRLLPSGDFSFDARAALSRRATRSIDAQYYQVNRDSVGLQFLRDLRDAAARGVRVRLLVDDLYTAGEDELFRSFASLPNVEVRLFNPLPSRSSTLAARLLFSLFDFGRINHRMHNKLYIADNQWSVSGGRNMADEYFMRSAAANFIDMDVIAAGPVVAEQSAVFDRFWASPYAWPIDAIVPSPLDAAASARRFDELVSKTPPEFEPMDKDPLGRGTVQSELATGRMPLAYASARVFADDPSKVRGLDRGKDVSTVTRRVLAEFETANAEITISSPYFIPGPIGMASMKRATEHGIRMSVFTNGLGATDEPLVHWRYARYRRDMLKIGVEIYELSPKLSREAGGFGDFRMSLGRLHAKVAVIDQHKLFIGSMNFDARSAWSNTEIGLLIESPALSENIADLVAHDRGESTYRLRLAADGDTIEWIATDRQGRQHVFTSEPDNDWWLQLKMYVLEPFASEELL